MKVRYSLVDGELVARDGTVLGQVVSLTLEQPRARVSRELGIEGIEKEKDPLTPAEPLPQLDPIQTVWAHYVEVMRPRHKDLDPDGRRIIADSLKVGTVEECCRAIDGCKCSAFHMGDNDRGNRYNRLSQILKGKRGGRTAREQLDFFIDLAESDDGGHESADAATLARAKRAVLDAHAFSSNEIAVSKGQAAEHWLKLHGWSVDRSGGEIRFSWGDA